ncbi:hypothetical protein ACQ4N7_25820 [Nodosilinea sp. AN01ver1]|uniref:hypothetical protein n=1 Tax=Nodosilinea sp. AN01ver1 TaxID=3423362 RepID=UPI003D32456E
MSSSHRPNSDLSAQVLETALGNYILLEVYRDAELSSHYPTPANSAPRPGLWSAAAVTVLGGLLALLAIEATPRAIASLSIHAQTTVTELGISTRWTF